MGSNENPAPHHETPTLGNPDLPQEGMQNVVGDAAATRMTGPRNPVLESQFPNVLTAPGTDVSTQPFFWSSFNIAPRRQQAGGWAREVTQADFAISDEISGVNMYLEPGGIRELHWHQTGEWAIMTQGKCRVTTLSREGRPSVEDVFKTAAAASASPTAPTSRRPRRSRPPWSWSSRAACGNCTGTRTLMSGSTTCKGPPG
jgi:oxalate decarboxylase